MPVAYPPYVITGGNFREVAVTGGHDTLLVRFCVNVAEEQEQNILKLKPITRRCHFVSVYREVRHASGLEGTGGWGWGFHVG